VRCAVVDHTTVMYFTVAPLAIDPPYRPPEEAAGEGGGGRISKAAIEEAAWLGGGDVSLLRVEDVKEASESRARSAKRRRTGRS